MLGAALAGGLVAVDRRGQRADRRRASASGSRRGAGLGDAARRRPRRRQGDRATERDDAPYLEQLREGWRVPAQRPGAGRHHRDGGADQPARHRLGGGAGAGVGRRVRRRCGGGRRCVFAVFAGASALGSLCAAAWADRLPRYATYLVAFLICGAPRFVVMAFDTPLWAVLVVAVVARVRRRVPQPDPRRGDLRADPRAPDGPGHLADDGVLLRADAVRRPGRRLPGRWLRARRRDAGLRRGVLRGHHAARRSTRAGARSTGGPSWWRLSSERRPPARPVRPAGPARRRSA